MLDRPIERVTTAMARGAARCRWVVLILSAVLAAAAWFGVSQLSFGGPGELFDSDDPGEVRYREWSEAFFDVGGEVVVLIDTGEHGEHETQAQAAANALGKSLREEPAVAKVVWGLDRNTVNPKLLLTQPVEEVERELGRIDGLRPILVSDTPTRLLQAGMAQAMTQAGASNGDGEDSMAALAEGAAVFIALMEAFTDRLQMPAEETLDLYAALEAALQGDSWLFMRSASGRLLVVRVNLRDGVDGQPGFAGSLQAVRRHIDAVRTRYEGVELGLTGFVPTSREAERAFRTASQRTAGGVLFALLFLTGFAWRSARLPIVVLITAATGVWWTLGWSGFVLSGLNPLSLVGVGIAAVLSLYGAIALSAAYARTGSAEDAAQVVAPGFALAVLTTFVVGAVVWFAPISDVPGLAQAGGVVLGGALAAGLAVGVVGPALLACVMRGDGGNLKREDLAGMLRGAARRRPAVAWVVSLVIAATLVAFAWRAGSTDDFSAYLPQDSEGAQWQQRALVDGDELGLSAAVAVGDLEEAGRLTAELRALPEVARVSGIARLAPESWDEKQALLRALDEQLGAAVRDSIDADPAAISGDPAALIAQVETTRFALAMAGTQVPAEARPSIADMDAAAAGFLETAQGLDEDLRRARLDALQNDYTACRQSVGRLISDLLEDRPLRYRDVGGAADVFSAWASKPDGQRPQRFTLKVYPTTAARGWPTAKELDAFIAAVTRVAPDVTGELERMHARSGQLRRSVLRTAAVFAVVLAALLFAFGGSWRNGVAVLLVLAVSAAGVAATMSWLEQPTSLVAWHLWFCAAALAGAWAAQLVRHAATPPTADAPRDTNASGSAAAEAFGLTLALSFVMAAGLRSAGAPGVTAVAIGLCVGAAAGGLVALLLIHPEPRPRINPDAASAGPDRPDGL